MLIMVSIFLLVMLALVVFGLALQSARKADEKEMIERIDSIKTQK